MRLYDRRALERFVVHHVYHLPDFVLVGLGSLAVLGGDDQLAERYSRLPTGQCFIGPYCRTPQDVQGATQRGDFRWYDTRAKQWRPLPPDVRTPNLAEGVAEHFQRGAYKSPTPKAAGRPPIPVIPHVNRIAVIGKETNTVALLTAEETDGHLMSREAGMDGAQVYGLELGGPDGIAERIQSERTSDLQVASGLPARTLRDLKSGKTKQPTPQTLAALSRGLWLLDAGNPDGIAGWRDIPGGELAVGIGNGWTREDVQGVRNATRALTEDERERFLAAIRVWKRAEQEAEAVDGEASDARAFVESVWQTDKEVAG